MLRDLFLSNLQAAAAKSPYEASLKDGAIQLSVPHDKAKYCPRVNGGKYTNMTTWKIELDEASRMYEVERIDFGLTWKIGPDGRERPFVGPRFWRRGGPQMYYSQFTSGQDAFDAPSWADESARFDIDIGEALIVEAARDTDLTRKTSLRELFRLNFVTFAIVVAIIAGLILVLR